MAQHDRMLFSREETLEIALVTIAKL